MRKLNSQFITTFVSEAGLDGQNGTYYGFVEMDRYYCMAVAEGYDGDGGFESAKLAVDAAIEAFVQKPSMKAGRIRACLKKAHKCLKEHSVRIRLKAGILLLVSDYTRCRYGVCGNVMLYAFRNAGIFHQSATHTVYQVMADKQPISGEGVGPKEETRNLYHYLGGSGGITVSGKVRLQDGDMVLAVTEGFWNRVNRVEMLDAYESIQSVEEFLGDLQELYLRGSTDGIPCCCLAAVEIKKAYKENTALKKKIGIWCLVILLILAIGGTVLALFIRAKRRKQNEIRTTVAVYEDTGDQYMASLNSLLAKQEYEKAAEESRKLDKNEERLENERLLSEKINISVMIDNAGKSYETKNYTQARNEYKNALETIEKEYVEREKFIIENRERFEKAQEESALKELELREKRDKIRETPEYAEHVMKEEQWLKEALQENNLDTLQEKKKKYEELKAQNPLTEYDEKIKKEKERKKNITDFIERCDNVLLECEKEKEESINQATKSKKNQLAENKQNVFQKVMGGLFYKINGTKKFASKVIGELEEKVYDINNKTLPAVREKISDGIDKSIEDIKQTCTQIADNTMKMVEDKLTQSIEKEKQVNVKRTGKFNVLMGETEGQK